VSSSDYVEIFSGIHLVHWFTYSKVMREESFVRELFEHFLSLLFFCGYDRIDSCGSVHVQPQPSGCFQLGFGRARGPFRTKLTLVPRHPFSNLKNCKKLQQNEFETLKKLKSCDVYIRWDERFY